MKKIKVYLAQPMSGRTYGEVEEEARWARSIADSYMLDGWSPPLKEAMGKPSGIMDTPIGVLRGYWKRDVQALARSKALIAIRGEKVSDGVAYEIGMAKHKYGIPVVVVSPYGPEGMITHLEADYVAGSMAEACSWLSKRFARAAKKMRKR